MNPEQLVNMMIARNPAIRNNPIFDNAMQMAKKGDCNGLKTLAQNMAKEKGVDIDQMKKQFGL